MSTASSTSAVDGELANARSWGCRSRNVPSCRSRSSPSSSRAVPTAVTATAWWKSRSAAERLSTSMATRGSEVRNENLRVARVVQKYRRRRSPEARTATRLA